MNFSKIHINPFYKFIFSFITGILIGLNNNWPDFFAQGFLLAIFLVIIYLLTHLFMARYPYRWMSGIFINFIFLLFGFLLVGAHQNEHSKHYFSNTYAPKDRYVAYVDQVLKRKKNSYQTILRVTHVEKEGRFVPVQGKVMTYLDTPLAAKGGFELGRYFLMQSNIKEVEGPKHPNAFNYKRYLANKKIYHQTYLSAKYYAPKQLNFKEHKPIFWAYKAQQKLLGVIDQYIQGDENKSVANALLLGYKNEITDHTSDNFKGSGAMHVLAVSGLHAGIIAYFFYALLFFLKGNRWLEILRNIIVIGLLWGYVFLTGMSPSVSRAVTMFSLYLIGKSFGRSPSLENIIVASAFLLLLVNPNFILEVGFQLSYAAVYGIVYFFPKFNAFLKPDLDNADTYMKYVEKVWKPIRTLLCISLAAQLGTFPLSLYYFHLFPNYFLLANIFVIPLATIILYAGVSLFALFSFSNFLAQWVGKICSWALQGLNLTTSFVHNLPFSTIQPLFIDQFQTILLYVIIICLLSFLILKNAKSIYLTLCALLALSFTTIYKQLEINKQKTLTAYTIGKTQVYQLYDQHKAYTFLPKTDQLFLDQLSYAIENNMGVHGITHNTYVDMQKGYSDDKLVYQNGVLFFDELHFVLDEQKQRDQNIINQIQERSKYKLVFVQKNTEISIDRYKEFSLLPHQQQGSYQRQLTLR